MTARTAWMKAVIALGLLAGAACPTAAQAPARNLDREQANGKVISGRFEEGGRATVFVLTLVARRAVEIEVRPVGGGIPRIAVFDARASEPFAINEDVEGTRTPTVRLFSAVSKVIRIEVSGSLGESAGSQFSLLLLPSDYRPNPERDIALGQSVEGALQRDDEQLFHFQGEAGQVWDFAFLKRGDSSALDPYLQVFAGSTAVGEPLTFDDDGAGNLNSQLRFSVPGPGPYTVRLSSLNESAGEYTFSANAGRVTPSDGDALSLGPAVTGEVGGKAESRVYRLSDSAKSQLPIGGGALIVVVEAPGGSGFDPLLEIGFDTPLGFSAALTDDDGGGGLNSCLRVGLAAFATYPGSLDQLRIRAGSALGGEGSFWIRLISVAPGDQTGCEP